MKRTIEVVEWPWAKDKKNPDQTKKPKVKSKIAESMKYRGTGKKPVLKLNRLQPITKIIRKPNGEVNKVAVKNMINSLSALLRT
jgi:hypothetical protein